MAYTLKIEQDSAAEDPRASMDNMATMTCFHKRYKLGDPTDLTPSEFAGYDALKHHLIEVCGAFVIKPLYLYDHSELSISTTPFSCRWDSGQVGFIWATKEEVMKVMEYTAERCRERKEFIEAILDAEVQTYDQFLSGDVWGYVIEDSQGNEVDSCCGLFGRDYAEETGAEALARLGEEPEHVDVTQQKLEDLLEFVEEVRRTGNTRLASMAIAVLERVRSS